MALQTIIISDLTGEPVDEAQHVRIVVQHPDYRTPLEIDAAVPETEKLVETSLRLIEFTIYAPNVPPRKAVMESKVVDKLIPNIEEVLQGARKATGTEAQPKTRKGASGGTSAPKPQKLDYTATENFGLIHRGKVTEEEARLVRENMAQANTNREREGQPKVGADPKDAGRYNLS